MTEQEIIDGNKLIKQFESDNQNIWNSEYFNESALNAGYDNDWNLLMPVVEKLSTLITDLDKSIYILEQKDCFWELKITSDINVVYKAVAEFLKYYNKNQK